jgi:GTP cyclohydrolase I
MFTPEEKTAISKALKEWVEFIHEDLRDEPTVETAMKVFDTNPYITALAKVDPEAATKIREFTVNDLRDYIEED